MLQPIDSFFFQNLTFDYNIRRVHLFFYILHKIVCSHMQFRKRLPKPPRPSLQLQFRGLRLRFRVHTTTGHDDERSGRVSLIHRRQFFPRATFRGRSRGQIVRGSRPATKFEKSSQQPRPPHQRRHLSQLPQLPLL